MNELHDPGPGWAFALSEKHNDFGHRAGPQHVGADTGTGRVVRSSAFTITTEEE